MSDVIEGMARAMEKTAGCIGREGCGPATYRELAQAALDYLKQPAPASKPLPEGQGPEFTIEQIRSMEKLG